MKLSKFGQFIRTYRINNLILLKDMADKLEMSSAFLSSIETARKAIPVGFHKKILAAFPFNEEEKKALLKAIDESKEQETIIMPDDNEDRYLIGAFCRNFDKMDEAKKKQLLKLLEDD